SAAHADASSATRPVACTGPGRSASRTATTPSSTSATSATATGPHHRPAARLSTASPVAASASRRAHSGPRTSSDARARSPSVLRPLPPSPIHRFAGTARRSRGRRGATPVTRPSWRSGRTGRRHVSAATEACPCHPRGMAIDFSAVGAALAAPARSAMLSALMDGSSRPASELAAAAGVRPSTASEHLAVLVGSGLLEVAAHGRHRYYRIADDGVADALERLGRLCPETPVRSYRQSREAAALEQARLCYDHLAGRLGVAVAESMTDRGWLDLRTPTLTDAGHAALSERGLDVAGLTGRRP